MRLAFIVDQLDTPPMNIKSCCRRRHTLVTCHRNASHARFNRLPASSMVDGELAKVTRI